VAGRAAAGEVLAQRDDRHYADDAHEDDRALDDPRSNVADGDALSRTRLAMR
jgi:hypothetical protein